MNEKELIKYYNKFNEDKRLKRRHGIVEFTTTYKYLTKVLKEYQNPKILDIGAGCGAYSIPLAEEGYDVTAIELVKHNLKVIEKNSNKVKTYLGNALNLSQFNDKSYDIILLLGPLYHLITKEEKIKALNEAKRVLKDNGTILIAYITNEYAVITHGFKERKIKEAFHEKRINSQYHITPHKNDLYSYVRIEDINELNTKVGLTCTKIIASDTIANYFRPYINSLTEEEFNLFLNYHFSICERKDIIGLSTHLLDIVKKS